MTANAPAALPTGLAAALRPVLPELAEAIIVEIGREVPDYARPLEGPFGRTLRIGVERALARFVDTIERPGDRDRRGSAIYVMLGRGEMRAGRSLDALLGAYRIGARLAWERFVAAGEAAGHEPATLYRLASAIFTYIDGISAESIEGFSQERAVAESERQRRSRALARLLTRDDVLAAEVHDLAHQIGWKPTARVAALVAGDGRSEPDPDRIASRLGADAIAIADGSLVLAWISDPGAPGRRAQLLVALGDTPAALGHAVALERASESLLRARAAHTLVLGGALGRQGELIVSDEHLPALLLHDGAGIVAELRARALAPLVELRPAPRERLLATLRAWLDHPGQVTRVAAELHVHPQTVRYRVAQLRELLGERLDDPEARFELALALRAGEPAPGA